MDDLAKTPKEKLELLKLLQRRLYPKEIYKDINEAIEILEVEVYLLGDR